MKKYLSFLLIAVLGFITLSCVERIDNDQDNDTYAVTYDLKNLNFTYNATNGYHISRTFNNPLFGTDVVLIYRQNGTTSNGGPVWQLIPRTLYLPQGELDYDFDFTVNDIMIYAGGDYDISTTPAYLNNQTFRVVIIPASGKNANVDFEDYDSVIKFYNIDDSKVINL